MNRTTLTLICLLPWLLAGCIIGDPGVARIVSLKIPQTTGKTNAAIQVGDAEVQKALEDIDGVLVSAGLTRLPNSSTPNSDGTIVRNKGPPTRGCGVCLRSNELAVVFDEFGRRSSSEPVKEICASLKAELTKHYGAKTVQVKAN